VTDASGRASTTYKADASACSGSNVRITASADGAIPLTGTIAVDAPKATNMQFVSAAPSLIYLTGSVGPTQSQVVFKVVDVSGNAVGNHAVQMSLVNAAPGVSLGSVGNISPLTVTSDADGKVTVPVFSGTVPTSVQVRATSVANSGVRADSNVLTVATGIPVQRAMSVALSKFSIEGLNVDGSTADVTVSLADRVGNPVPDGTQVNFVSSSGVMIPPVCVVSGGTSSCKSQIRSQGTRPADGRVAVMAYVPGEEDFIDANGNNVFDNGESYTDMGNAHMDANFNGSYDTGEFTVPRAGTFACAAGLNGRPNTCDAQWGAIDVRRQAMVVFASSLPIFSNPATVTRSFQYLGKTVTEVISVSIDVADTNGNSLATETSVKGSAASGVHTDVPSVVCQFAFEGDLTGTRTALIANRVGPTRITFNLTGCYVGIGDRIGFSTTSPTGVVSAPFNVSF
jgi:hypothetical protein